MPSVSCPLCLPSLAPFVASLLPMSVDVTRLAARRLAAQARNARRQAEADEAFEDSHNGGDDTDMASSSAVRMIGTALDLADTRGGSAAAAAAASAQSAHDQRREINQLIYGRLNVVEDGKAFEPAKFVSSRSAKAKAAAEAAAAASASASTAGVSRVQRVEDFMDDEDLADGQAGGAGATSGAGLAARAAFKRPSAAAAAAGGGDGGAFVAPASQGSIALHMLKAMGWRTGVPKKKPRVYGAALPPGMGGATDAEGDQADDDASALRSMMGADEGDVALYTSREKNDTYGIGHTPYSQLSTAARNQHDAGYAPLTFVRAKQLTAEALAVLQPKVYTIDVPDSFNSRHVFPIHEQAWQMQPQSPQPPQQPPLQPAQPVAPPQPQLPSPQPQQQPPRHSNALITDWQSKMDASRRALVESLPRLPLPPMPPPAAAAASAAPTAQTAPAPSPASASSAAPISGASALDLQRQRRLEAMAEAERGSRPAPFGRMLNSQQQLPPASEPQPGRIDIRAAIAAAAEKAAAIRAEREAEQRKAERRSKWGPLPAEAAALNPAQFPLAAAFLSANFGDAPPQLAVPLPSPSLLLPPPPPPAPAAPPAVPGFTVPPSLSALFPKFVVAGVQDPAPGASSAALTSDTATAAAVSSSAAADEAMMDKFAPASSSTTPAAASTLAASSSAAAVATPIDPNSTGPFASYFAAARLKMFGKLTRRVEEWTPHNLVYKRFGVPPPQGNKQNFAASRRNTSTKRTAAATAVSSAAGDSVPGFPSFVQSSTPFGSVSDPSAAAAAVEPAAAPALSVAEIQAEIAREEEEAIKADLARDNDDDKQHAGGPTGDSAPESKPSLDLFRAIFETSDDEEATAPSSLKHKRAAARKPHAQLAMQQPAPPAAPAAPAAKSTPSSFVDSIFGSSAARPANAPPPVSSGFVHPDRLRQVPTAAAAVSTPSAGFAASSSVSTRRDVVSLEDDFDEGGDAELSITGFSHKKTSASSASASATSQQKFVPAGFRSKPLHFVPASGKPGPPNTKAAAAGNNSRGERFGGGGEGSSYGEDDDAYGSSSSAPFGAVRGGLAPLAPAGSMEESFRSRHASHSRRGLSREPAPVLQHFLPPPVPAPRVAPVLPPPVPQSWPFAPQQFGGSSGSKQTAAPLPPQHAAAHRPSAPAPASAASAAASASSSPADSSTLLSQLLDLHKALKSSKKHAASSSSIKEEGAKKEKKEKKDKRSKKHKSCKGDKERKKKHRTRSRSSSRSRSKHHKRESKSRDSSSSSSDDSDVEVIERAKA